MSRIAACFDRLSGEMCWGVKRGYANCLTLEFGKPHLEIKEPWAPEGNSRASSRRLQEWRQRRVVWVRGQWHLWIYRCDWEVRRQGRVIGDWSTPRRADRAADFLDGQKLTSVSLRPVGARTLFRFDLGAELATKPVGRSGEQWLLYEPNGQVLSFRADRKYSYGHEDRDPRKERWWRMGV